MKIFNWINIRLLLMISLVIFLFSFTTKRNEQRKLKKSVVFFLNMNDRFVQETMVNKLLIENKSQAQSIRKDALDLSKIEKSIDSNPMIERSEVFVSIDGVLKAVVKQKTPVGRIFKDNKSYYIDYKGGIMPLSENFTARVPLVLGEISQKNEEDLSKLLRFVYDDEFLKKNIIGMQILRNGSLKMQNRNFEYEIEFGNSQDFERKFNNYKAFYQKAVLDSSLYNYKKIDLRFSQQVVCTK